jgi:5-methylcytosine-specific restriction endonuclease McrA
MQDKPPDNLEIVDPNDRQFPPSWRDAATRALFDPTGLGVRCPGCSQFFNGRRELSLLQSDHIHPWSRGGLTIWENMQLLCRPCNRAKSDKIQIDQAAIASGDPSHIGREQL